jgi:hypothetical protein
MCSQDLLKCRFSRVHQSHTNAKACADAAPHARAPAAMPASDPRQEAARINHCRSHGGRWAHQPQTPSSPWRTMATAAIVSLLSCAAVLSNPAPAVRPPPWPPASSPQPSVQDLHREYGNIFKHGNRNAASHRWSTFLLDRSEQMTAERLAFFFSGFCAVSGSPVRPNDYNRYRLTLPRLGGGSLTGYMHYCCWPCVCDTQDFIRVDTRNVSTSEGSRQMKFVVIGNPCDHPEKLTEPFIQPFDRRQTTIAESAREVRCLPGGILEGATMSDHGYVIINMFFDAAGNDDSGVAPGALVAMDDPTPGRIATGGGGVMFQDEREYSRQCADRAAHGYNSGMGEIFRRAAGVSPVDLSKHEGEREEEEAQRRQMLGSGAVEPEGHPPQTCEEGNRSACDADSAPPTDTTLPPTEAPPGTCQDVRQAFLSTMRSILTEIYLRHACSCQEILRGNAWAGLPQLRRHERQVLGPHARAAVLRGRLLPDMLRRPQAHLICLPAVQHVATARQVH